ncbi:MAG: HutD family protein [Roseiflexaceae bacterium]|nr:HutD family protein [Roseiflexaceae bacterium]
MKQPIVHGTRIDRAQQIPGTWAGGTTQQIYAFPPDPPQTIASAQFWLGTAIIQRDAAYSFFPERTRIHIPIQGNGIRLHFQAPEDVIKLNTYETYCFDGARPVCAELVDGPIVALNFIFHANVIVAAAIVQFDEQQLLLPALTASEIHKNTEANRTVLQIIYVIAGTIMLRVAGNPTVILNPDDAYIVHPHTIVEHMPILLERQESPAQFIVATAWLP